LQARCPPVINHPQSAAFTFAAPHIGEPKLAQTSGVLDQVADLWSLQQEVLKRQKAVIIKIVRPVALESGSSMKTAFIAALYATYVYTQAA